MIDYKPSTRKRNIQFPGLKTSGLNYAVYET